MYFEDKTCVGLVSNPASESEIKHSVACYIYIISKLQVYYIPSVLAQYMYSNQCEWI